MLNKRDEEIIKAVSFYRYMTSLDVTHLISKTGKKSSKTHVQGILNELAGGSDKQTDHYLYRFTRSNGEKVYTLGRQGRNFLVNELRLHAPWYFRPDKLRFLSHGHLIHSLLLTRIMVAAQVWNKQQSEYRLLKTQISYELPQVPIIPDGWLLFERKDGMKGPILLEIDKATEYQKRFKEHIAQRIEFISSGGYQQLFGERAVTVAYVTTGDTPEYRNARLADMCRWTLELLAEQRREDWTRVFRFTSVSLEEVYATPLFNGEVWRRPDTDVPTALLV